MLCWNTEIACISECIHSFSAGEQGIELGVVGILFFLWGGLWGWGRERGSRVERWMVVELRETLLFAENTESGLVLLAVRC